jgi:hypothetical protein
MPLRLDALTYHPADGPAGREFDASCDADMVDVRKSLVAAHSTAAAVEADCDHAPPAAGTQQ